MFRPRHLAVAALTALTVAATAIPAAHAAGDNALNAAQQDQVKSLVREYLLENPEVIAEAIGVLRQRQESAQAAQQTEILKSKAAALFDSPEDPVLANPDGDITLVEFFDYRCGYCKAVFPHFMELAMTDPGVRLKVKEFPILGPESLMAARWAMASREQGKYGEYHAALMAHRGAYTETTLREIATKVGLDADKLAVDADAEKISAHLKANMELAGALDINGTPAFVVGDALVPGAVSLEELQKIIQQQRAARKADKKS